MARSGFPKAVLMTAALTMIGPATPAFTPLMAQEGGTGYPASYDDGIRGICEKCAAPTPSLLKWMALRLPNWGYGYADLRGDLFTWSRSRWVTLDSIGASVENRAIWELTITDPAAPSAAKHRVYIHTRTHPNEVQTTHVVNEIIAFLLADDPEAADLRSRFIFHVVPMYNPDGVELEKPRENAHDIDLERGWDKTPMEPEVASLHRRFAELMSSARPIELALNLHSAGLCKRYFVYHDATGTSEAFAALQQRFIENVRAYFPQGIEPWSFYKSWVNETPTHFPESFWWLNYRERVLALTYEDMNCASAGMYDSTAAAILRGIGRHFEAPSAADRGDDLTTALAMSVMPNPATDVVSIRYRLPEAGRVTILLHDQLGRLVATPLDSIEEPGAGEARFQVGQLAPGVYLCTLRFGLSMLTSSITILR